MQKFFKATTGKPKLIIAIFLVLFVISFVCSNLVAVNYEITDYLPDNTKSTITFKAPAAGAYRLYVFVTDEENHKAALACIPFLAE